MKQATLPAQISLKFREKLDSLLLKLATWESVNRFNTVSNLTLNQKKLSSGYDVYEINGNDSNDFIYAYYLETPTISCY